MESKSKIDQSNPGLDNSPPLSNKPSECVVSGALALVLRISRCAGVAPIRVSAAPEGWRITVKPSLAIVQRTTVIILNITIFIAVVLDLYQDGAMRFRVGKTALTAYVGIANLVLVTTIASIVVYWGSARMENLIRILKQLKQININLNTERCSKTESIGIIAVVYMSTLAVTVQVVEFYSLSKNNVFEGVKRSMRMMYMYAVFYVANSQGLLALMLWGCSVAEVHAASSALNRHLARLLHELELTFDASHTQAVIRHLALSHEQIGEVMKQMNTDNGVFIIAILMSTFLHLMITPYYLLLWLNSDETVWKTVFLQLSWSLLHMTALLLTIDPCHWTQEQRETTKYLLSRLMVRLTPRAALLSRELERFAKQTTLTDVKFAPLSIYTLDRPYMAAILGGVTTYLVILLQFQTHPDHHLVKH